MIPTKKTEPSFNLHDYSWLIYGQEKIGKSTFVSQFDHVLFIPTEAGLNSLSVYKACEGGHINSWAEFGAIVEELEKEKAKGTLNFDSVAIDTIDNLYDMCLEHVCKKEEMSHPSDGAFGKGWAAVNKAFQRGIMRLSAVTKIIFISHAVIRETEVNRIKVNQMQPTISGKAGLFIKGFVDIVGYVAPDPLNEGGRIVHFRGSEGLIAGDRTGRLLERMSFDYKLIKDQFESKKNKKEKGE